MTTKVKGLLKGLRYISQIFDPKEEEMQIGFPTDVKHVAHIGWDGPSVNTPSWMNGFRSAPLSITGSEASAVDETPAPAPELRKNGDTPEVAPATEARDPALPKSRRHASTGSADAPSRSANTLPRRRRNKSISEGVDVGGAVGDSSVREGPMTPAIPKSGRKKKAKAGDGEKKAKAGDGEKKTKAGDGGSAKCGKARSKVSLIPSEKVVGGPPHEVVDSDKLPVVLSPVPGEGV